MVYEFIYFEEQFHSLTAKEVHSKNFTVEFTKGIERELIRLKKVFRDVAVLGKSKKNIITYFYFHQKNLIILMDRLHNESLNERNISNKQLNNYLELFIQKLSAFFDWLQKMFPKYINNYEKLPDVILHHEILKIKLKIVPILDELASRNFKSEIIEMVKLISNPNLVTHQKDIIYYGSTWNIIHRKIIEHNICDEFELIKIFVESGVNHSEFYRYSTNYIIREVEKKQTLDQQISTICGFRKDIRLLYTEIDHKQFLDYPDIRKLLKKFIKEELLLLKAMEFVNHGLAEAGIMNANYKVSLSVKQLAFFVHLQMETGIIIWQRAKFAHQYIARHFSTVERESISEKSLRNAHYNHAGEDIKKVVTKLGEMLALAQEKY